MNPWSFYFGWYQGAVYSNLLASGLCAGLVYWRARVHLHRHRDAADQERADDRAAHEEMHAKTHALIAGIHARLDAVESQEDESP